MGSLPFFDMLRCFAPHISRTRSFFVEGFSDVHTVSYLLLCSPVHALDNILGRQTPSLRFVTFFGISLASLSTPNLTELNLILYPSADPIHISLLFRLFSSCPRLQELLFKINCRLVQDVSLDHVILLDSLEKLEHYCWPIDLSFTVFNGGNGTTAARWFSDEPSIPFGQIEDLGYIGFYISADCSIRLLRNVTEFRVFPWN